MTHPFVIVTANVGLGPSQRIDIDIIDFTAQRNVYLSKKDIKDEIDVCFKTILYQTRRLFPVSYAMC